MAESATDLRSRPSALVRTNDPSVQRLDQRRDDPLLAGQGGVHTVWSLQLRMDGDTEHIDEVDDRDPSDTRGGG